MECAELDAKWDPRSAYRLSERERSSGFAMEGSNVYRHPALSVTERSVPEPARDEVLIEVGYAGICGSDVHMLAADDDGYTRYAAYMDLPTVPGHEFAGRIVETGADVRAFDVGELVTSEVTEYCGSCGMCRRSLFTQCERFEEIGFTTPGAFAEYVAVPEKIVWSLEPLRERYDDEDRILRVGATVEPTTISYFGLYVRAGGVLPGETVVFHGGGPIGLTGAALAVAGGARVFMVEPIERRRELAEAVGCEHVFAPGDHVAERIVELTGGRGADVHVETAGAVEVTYDVIQRALGPHSSIVQIGVSAADPHLDLRAIQSKQAQVVGSQGHTGNRVYPLVIELLASGGLSPEPLITDVYPLSAIESAIDAAAARTGGKLLVRP